MTADERRLLELLAESLNGATDADRAGLHPRHDDQPGALRVRIGAARTHTLEVQMIVQKVIVWLGLLAAIVSAACWTGAALIKTPPLPSSYQDLDDLYALGRSVQKQSRWNAAAAFAAALSAVLQLGAQWLQP
jgi:hypothetical protein